MAKKDPIKEFIEGLSLLDYFKGDPDAKDVEEALTRWMAKNYPEGFNFSSERRDLTIAMVKKSAEIIELIRQSDFMPYIHALFQMKVTEICNRRVKAKQKRGEIADFNQVLREAFIELAEEIFTLGYVLKSLEEKKNEKKK